MKTFGIILSYIFRLVPSFCISYGYSELMSKNALFAIDYFKSIDDFEKVKNDYDFYQDIKKYHYLKNRNGNAFINNEVKNVLCEGINEDYTLTIKYDDKQIRINSGEISFHA